MARKQDIEDLRTTLMGIMQYSSAKKIDVDDLKRQLAQGVRQNKYKADTSSPIKKEKETLMRKMDASYIGGPGQNHSMSQTQKHGNNTAIPHADGSDPTPDWYKTLKKNMK
jgi:hypothetical protein